MTSSMLSGERRWVGASSRRGGMTVLGKVAVPKPINLPSQRLENHGLDPNVEIVPKGTLSWGGRSSSSASNPWGSSLSPNTDGGTSSSSHLSTRPSSGGSGTRPSTAGSDRTLDTTSNAWGSNSRPSSASGALISNQTSLTSLRPRSAETRPSSSQLSRFAEPLIENSGAWSSARTTENLGAAQPKNDEFSLSSGDFPTLGSDKDKSVLNSEMQDHSSESHARPGSSSGPSKEIYDTSSVDDVHANNDVKGGTVDSWRRDYQAHNDDGVRPSIETWQRNTHPYPNAGVPPQHFDAWHGPPVNNPQGGVWFRGPPSRPPFGNPVAPGGFPIEPFPYYRPHIPTTGLANPQPVPPPGSGPRGHHKDRDAYRPHMPDAYVHPGVPIRPGFYPGPMGYEGYYGPPMGYCNPNEREVPFMGIAAGRPIYNRYPNQNPPEPGNSQCRSGGYGTAGKPLTSEHVEFSHPPDISGPYRVLLKQHESDEKNKPENWEDSVTTGASYVNGREQAKMGDWESEQRSNYRKNEEIDLRISAHGEEASSYTFEKEVSGSSVIKAKSLESSGNMNKSGDISARKLDDATSDMLEVPRKSSVLKDTSLIHKIEGLNAKARDNSSARNKEEQRSKFHAGSTIVNQVESEAGAAIFNVRTHATEVTSPTHLKVGASGGQKNLESLSIGGKATFRQTAHGMQCKSDHRNKGILTNQDADGWRMKSVAADSLASSGPLLEASDVLVGDHRISIETYDRSGSYNKGRHDGESVQARSDSVDDHAQRAKMKELAKQRTKQLQEEEEERIRRQKAKALAKLDELNRRSQTVAGSTQKESATSSAVQNKQDELQPSESAVVADKSGVVKSAINSNTNTISQFNDINYKVGKPILSSEPPLVTHKSSGKGIQNMPQDADSADATNVLQVYNTTASKQKRMSYKQKQNITSAEKLSEKVVSTNSTALKFENDKVVDYTTPSCDVTKEVGLACGPGFPLNSTAMVEPSVNPKKNRNVKNKHKFEESLSLTAPKESNLSESSFESDKPKASDFELDQGLLHPASLSKDSKQLSEKHRHLANEESHVKMISQGKLHDSRRKPRNLLTNRSAEKSHGGDVVMWAPVKPQNNNEVIEESSEKSNAEAANPVKRDQVRNLKNKRAEMERYIPKPVAKEMAQQGSTNQVVSPISQATAGQDVERVASGPQSSQTAQHTNSAFGKVGFIVESKNRDGRHNKQGKAHGSWQQRNLTESTSVHDMQVALDHDSNSVPNVQKPSEHHVDHTSETSLVKGQTKHFNDSSGHDCLSNLINHDSAAPVIKDHAVTGRGRGPFRGHKGPGVNHDADHNRSTGEIEKIEKHVSSSEHSQTDVVAASKENQVAGERLTSHWQPKHQASNNQRGYKPIDQNFGSLVIGVKKDPTLDSESIWAGHNKESNAYAARPHHDKSVSGKSKERETSSIGNQESGRERKNAPAKRPSLSPNQVSSVEQTPTSVDLRHEQHPSSGFGKNGNQNRFGRGHESRGDWKSPAQDNRHRNHQHKNRERPGSNMHYEYQPVGPYDDSNPDHFGRPRDSSYGRPRDGHHGGERFMERGHTHSRRGAGNLQGRQGGVD